MHDTMTAIFTRACALLRSFAASRRGNVAMMFGIALVPMMIATGAGLDYARASLVKSQIADALDAAALAVGSGGFTNEADAKTAAQNIFNANYKGPGSVDVSVKTFDAKGSVTLGASSQVSTALLKVVGVQTIQVATSSTVVWGQSKLWVSLVLDNTGSMCEPDSNPCPGDTSTKIKINALKKASHNLLTTLQNASVNPGDVMVSIVPFAKDVNVGTANVAATWIDWSDWETAMPTSDKPGSSTGPGSNCPFSNTYNGCLDQPGGTMGSDGVTMATVSSVPNTGAYAGYICPGAIRSSSSGQAGHYYNGCWNSTPTQTLVTTTVTKSTKTDTATCASNKNGKCTGTVTNDSSTSTGSPTVSTQTNSGYSGDSSNTQTSVGNPSTSTKTTSSRGNYTTVATTTTVTTTTVTAKTGAGPYSHAWVVNNHNTWRGCVMDRNQNDDANNTTPGTKFPAENSDSCPRGIITPMANPAPTSATGMASMFANLNTQIDAMTAAGGTNQTIGLAHGMQTLTSDLPYSPIALPANTTRYIILLSDGLNTMDRWYGNGSSQSTSVDNRMAAACTNAKQQGFVIYTVFVNLGSSGNSTVLKNCATDTSKYYQLTTADGIVTAFDSIAQQITSVRVSQ